MEIRKTKKENPFTPQNKHKSCTIIIIKKEKKRKENSTAIMQLGTLR